MRSISGLTLILVGTLAGCSQSNKRSDTRESMTKHTLTNSKGIQATVTNYGGRVMSLKTPDRSGQFADVVLGFDNPSGYTNTNPYFGALIGRYGNRIGNARFNLNGIEYKLAQNDGKNSLHGGLKGFDKVLWTVREIPGGEPALEL